MTYKWQRSQIEKLIVCVEQSPCIYNIKSQEYLNKKKKDQAFKKILDELRKKDTNINLEEVKRKWRILRIQYRQELRDFVKQSKEIGDASEDSCAPKLWCFKQLSFLRPYCDITEACIKKMLQYFSKTFLSICKVQLQYLFRLHFFSY